jgi:aminoglycoside N3'-acetyltransferase
MKEYFNILKYGIRNIYNVRIKSYKTLKKHTTTRNAISNFVKEIQSDTVVAFVGLKQIKYYAGIDNPAEYIIDLFRRNFKNIIIPTFTASVKKTKYFDIENTPSDSGAFSNYFLKFADFRTPSPFKSFAIIGPISEEIKNLQFENDFENNGIFEFIHSHNIPSLNIGTSDIRFGCIHFAEYIKKVPYSKIENSMVKIKFNNGSTQLKKIEYFDYKLNYKINRDKIEKDLTNLKLIRSQISGGINLRFIPQDGYFSFFLDRIDKDPHYLIN